MVSKIEVLDLERMRLANLAEYAHQDGLTPADAVALMSVAEQGFDDAIAIHHPRIADQFRPYLAHLGQVAEQATEQAVADFQNGHFE